MGKAMYEHVFGAALVSIAFLAMMWGLGALGFSGITLTALQWVVGGILIFVASMYLSLGFLHLSADNRHKDAGGMKGEVSLGVILIVGLAMLFAGMGIYAVFLADKAPAQTITAPPMTSSPVLPAGAGTGTYMVQGYANSVALQPQSCPQVTQGFTQTLTLAAVDASSQASVAGLTSRQMYDLNSGDVYPGSGANGNNQTSQGEAIKVLSNISGRIATVSVVRTGCAESSPKLVTKIKAFDTSVNITAVNPNSYTTNDGGARVTFTAATAASKTFLIKVTPSANDLYLAGGDENEFVILYNASNVTAQYDAPNFGATLGAGWVNAAGQSVAGSQCRQLSLPATPSGLGGNFIVALACKGDFKGTDAGSAYEIQYRMAVSNQWGGNSVTTGTWNIMPMSYYVRATTQAGAPPRGSVQPGVVNDAGVMPDNTPEQLHIYLD